MDGILALLCIVVSLSLLVYLVVSFISWLGQRPCEMCGCTATLREVSEFRLCKKCRRIAKASTTPVADLMAQTLAARSANETAEQNLKADTLRLWLTAIAVLVAGTILGPPLVGYLRSDGGRQLMGRVSGIVSKPRLPVVVIKRPSAVGEGLVLSFENQTDHQITVGVIVERDGKTAGRWGASVPPNGSKEFGWAEGWAFKQGDRFTLVHPEYRDESHVID